MKKEREQSTDDHPGEEQTSPVPLHEPDPDDTTTEPGGDQDIDTAGTDADDDSPTKAMGTGIARNPSRG